MKISITLTAILLIFGFNINLQADCSPGRARCLDGTIVDLPCYYTGLWSFCKPSPSHLESTGDYLSNEAAAYEICRTQDHGGVGEVLKRCST